MTTCILTPENIGTEDDCTTHDHEPEHCDNHEYCANDAGADGFYCDPCAAYIDEMTRLYSPLAKVHPKPTADEIEELRSWGGKYENFQG